MPRPKLVLVSAVVTLAGVGFSAPVAGAAPPPSASCAGVLSSFVGQAGTRAEFAPLPGQLVSGIARQHGDFDFCLAVFQGG